MIALLLLIAADCSPCHSEIVKAYSTTPMARSSGPVQSLTAASYRHPQSKTRYVITPPNLVRIETPQQRATQVLQYFIGSGAHGRSFLFTRGGKLFEAPITEYAGRGWAMSPGYENDDHSDWTRPIDRNCLWCHASSTKLIYGTVNQYANPPFAENGITCERCHAATATHYTNPVKLPVAARNDTCRQCHLLGIDRKDKPGHSFFEYKPGMLLDSLVTYETVAQQPASDLKVTGHFERLAMSRCQISSGDKLWCGSCHNPHRVSDANQSCRSCHAGKAAHGGNDCQSCHMPKAPSAEANHSIFTDHWIR